MCGATVRLARSQPICVGAATNFAFLHPNRMRQMARNTELSRYTAQMRVVARFAVFALVGVCFGLPQVQGQDLKITLPRRSQLTPVQRLNRDGVDAVRKQQYDKAEALFYKAYLYDPSDPFTLNNLGYIAELQGELDRAQQFYKLASEQGTDAYIDRSN